MKFKVQEEDIEKEKRGEKKGKISGEKKGRKGEDEDTKSGEEK
jgi:hypothetical protein